MGYFRHDSKESLRVADLARYKIKCPKIYNLSILLIFL